MLLSRFTANDVCSEPFPHVACETAIDAALCRRLIQEFPYALFPAPEQRGANKKHYHSGIAALRDPRTSPAWKDLLRTHLQPALWTELVRVFEPHLLAEFPHLRPPGGWSALRVGMLGVDDFTVYDVLLDSKVLLHSPHDGDAPYERWPHIKRFSSVFFGYLYLRPADDNSQGGDHAFYALKPAATLELDARQTVDPALLDVAKVFPYAQGSFVCFMNTARSIQTMTPRARSTHPLLAHHFTVYLADALFTVPTKPGIAPMMLGRELAPHR